MLSADIECRGLKSVVRIRNLSASGAMLDGPVLPEVGETLTLRRMEFQIEASVVWRAAGRCGVSFDGVASVEDWIAGRGHGMSCLETGQARVDAIQAAIRRGDPLMTDDTTATAEATAPDAINERVAEEIAYVRRMLDAIADELLDDGIVMQRHAQALQNFDIASQILRHLGTIIVAPDPAQAADAVDMQELRTRLLRKPNF